MNLIGQLYLPKNIDGEVKLQGRIRKSSRMRTLAFQDWSLVEREWSLRPSDKLFPLYNDLGVVREGGSFSIPLYPDLPPGEYLIELEIVGSESGYVSLAEIAKKGLIPMRKSIKLEMHE